MFRRTTSQLWIIAAKCDTRRLARAPCSNPLAPLPSVGGGAHWPLTTQCPCSASLAYPYLPGGGGGGGGHEPPVGLPHSDRGRQGKGRGKTRHGTGRQGADSASSATTVPLSPTEKTAPQRLGTSDARNFPLKTHATAYPPRQCPRAHSLGLDGRPPPACFHMHPFCWKTGYECAPQSAFPAGIPRSLATGDICSRQRGRGGGGYKLRLQKCDAKKCK